MAQLLKIGKAHSFSPGQDSERLSLKISPQSLNRGTKYLCSLWFHPCRIAKIEQYTVGFRSRKCILRRLGYSYVAGYVFSAVLKDSLFANLLHVRRYSVLSMQPLMYSVVVIRVFTWLFHGLLIKGPRKQFLCTFIFTNYLNDEILQTIPLGTESSTQSPVSISSPPLPCVLDTQPNPIHGNKGNIMSYYLLFRELSSMKELCRSAKA